MDLFHPDKGWWKNLKTKDTAHWYEKGQQRRHDRSETSDGTVPSTTKHLLPGGSSKRVWILLLIWILALTLFLYLAHSLSLFSIYIRRFAEWFLAAFVPSWEQVFQCLSAVMYTNRCLIQAKMTSWETKIPVWVITCYSTEVMHVLNKQRADEKLIFKSYTGHVWSLRRQTLDWNRLTFPKK